MPAADEAGRGREPSRRARFVPSDELTKALDDIDGLQEAYVALSDRRRRSSLVQDRAQAMKYQRELASASDAYAATIMSTRRGEFDRARLRKCRAAAMDLMPAARRSRRRLAALVEERRLPTPELHDDLERLLTLSLHCRAALDSFAPTVDRRAAESLGNKILVELRRATLLYLAAARDAADRTHSTPRAAVVELLKKTDGRARGLLEMAPAPDAANGESSLGASLSRDVADELHRTSQQWQAIEEGTAAA